MSAGILLQSSYTDSWESGIAVFLSFFFFTQKAVGLNSDCILVPKGIEDILKALPASSSFTGV